MRRDRCHPAQQLALEEQGGGSISSLGLSASDGFGAPSRSQQRHRSPQQGPSRGHKTRPPAGCGPDAIKLFLGNLPLELDEAQLLPLLETAGEY